MSINEYIRASNKRKNDKEKEADVLVGVNTELKECIELKLPYNDNRLKNALLNNQRYWNAIKMSVASPENKFDDKLKASFISLAIWVDKHTNLVLTNEEDALPLVENNDNIIQGLKGIKPSSGQENEINDENVVENAENLNL